MAEGMSLLQYLSLTMFHSWSIQTVMIYTFLDSSKTALVLWDIYIWITPSGLLKASFSSFKLQQVTNHQTFRGCRKSFAASLSEHSQMKLILILSCFFIYVKTQTNLLKSRSLVNDTASCNHRIDTGVWGGGMESRCDVWQMRSRQTRGAATSALQMLNN